MKTDKNIKIESIFMRLWSHMSVRRRLQFLFLLIFIIASSFVEVVSIGAIVPFLSFLVNPEKILAYSQAYYLLQFFGVTQGADLLLAATAMFVAVVFISGLIRVLLLWFQTQFCHAVGSDFSAQMYKKTLYQPYEVQMQKNSSEVISAISISSKALVGNALLPLMTIISSLMLLGVIFLALVSFEPLVAMLAFCGFGFIYFIVSITTKKTLLKNSHIISSGQSQIIKALQEGLGGIRDVLIDGTQSFYCKVFDSAERPLRRAIANVQIITACPRYVIETLGIILAAFLGYFLVKKSDGLLDVIPILGVFALGSQKMLPLLQQSYASWASIRGGHALICDALRLLDQKLPEYLNQENLSNLTFEREIALKNVSFAYSLESGNILRDIDLEIAKGDRVGIIGQTGSGKSTFLDLLMGLLLPTYGDLLVDGIRIDAKNSRLWQRNIAHVPQSIYLTDSTIAENIAFGVDVDKIDYQQVERVAEAAQIHSLINSWPDGYGTNVGERGVRLSGGQRQRIGIARALYKNATVLIFDEATSSLDGDTEAMVMDAIDGLSAELTVIIVAHRLSTLKRCNKIIEFDRGAIKRICRYQDIF